jgi:MFS transporter, ACS family, hexuronate transporter
LKSAESHVFPSLSIEPCEDALKEPQTFSVLETVSRYRWMILALAFVSQLTSTLAGQVIPPLAPVFQAELGLSKVEIGLFSSAAFMGSWGVLLVAGYLTERFGVRASMSLGQIVAGGVMLGMAVVGTFVQALAVMFVVGLTRAVVLPGASKAVMDWFPARERATAMGIKQTGYPAAGIIMAATLPALALAIGWRYAIALVGFVIIAGGVVTLIMYKDPAEDGSAVRRQPSMRAGLRQLVRIPSLWVVASVATLLVTAQLALIAYLALYFSDVVLLPIFPEEGARIVAAGGFLALLQVGGVVGRVFWGVVSDRVFPGQRMAVIAAIGALAGLMALVMGYLSLGLPIWLLAAFVFIYGVTAVGWNGLYHALVVETAGRTQSAMAVGFCMTLSQVGTVAGPPLFGFIVDQAGSYQPAWLCLSLLSLGGALVAGIYSRGENPAA